MRASRFDCPSAPLPLRALLERARHVLWIGCAVALLVHAGLSLPQWVTKEQRTAKPLTTKFVKRQPRLSKPLEMKKLPRPKRRRIQRKMVAVRAKARRQQLGAAARAAHVLGRLAQPRANVSRIIRPPEAGMEPQQVAQHLASAKDAEQAISLSLEMIDIDALDTGQYQAMVVQDPNDKRSITGYFHFWMPWGVRYSDAGWHDWPNRVKYAVRRVVLKVSEWTDISVDVKGIIGFDSEQLLETPWVVVGHWFNMYATNAELGNMCRYMNTGGFIYTEGEPDKSDHCRVIKAALEFGGLAEQANWTWERLPHSHALFHCYFDFSDGPPPGAQSVGYQLWGGTPPQPPRIEAIELAGRIAAITSNAGYISPWGDWGKDGMPSMRNSAYSPYDPKRQLQFGVNTIIFALTQEGSVTRRLMDGMR